MTHCLSAALLHRSETLFSCSPQNAELRKTYKSLEGKLAGVSNDLSKKTAEAEGLGKKVAGLKDRLGQINADGREAEQRHKFVIQRLTDILSGGPGDLDGEWQMLKDALREEHELELSTLTEEKVEKWRFELNKMDNEISHSSARLDDANVHYLCRCCLVQPAVLW